MHTREPDDLLSNPDEPGDRTRTADVSRGSAAPPPMQQGVYLMIPHETGDKNEPLLAGKPVVVGRDLPSDVCIPDPELSRRHARFTLLDNKVLVEDLGSKNGTFIGGRRITSDTIALSGEVMLNAKTIARITAFGVAVEAEKLASAAHWSGIIPPVDDDAPFFGTSPKMQALLHAIDRIADSQLTVLLHGETGTGKEEFAKLIHARGPRHRKQLVTVNCGGIPPSLIQSTFFGHERGSFTGAEKSHLGFFPAADGGTLFLDEIGELSHEAQATLLRVLETRSFSPVGSPREVTVDVRIVAATNRDLEAMVREGRFREDLLSRLGTPLVIPPLRERRDEISPLCQRFLARANKDHGKNVQGITSDAMLLLHAYDWPRNVRELRRAIDEVVVWKAPTLIRPQDLPTRVQAALPDPKGADVGGLKAELEQVEAQKIADALQQANGNRDDAAKALLVNPRTLRRRMKELGIETPKKKR
ncbi:sigma 54-dependent Fis family transcriptional regulator [Polyangium sp. y55x31]|uniref:sigma 54-dependent Fis family transcriptional regulator n=1 Tax=Polyangium sp. y55x31 TaxID=3042688 RepID=UPI0024822361|nr:sigma 54-dependent Fis family transcriptional regulator [Polyangium sp. y55x31]MDI1480399.1 sigma 54-dependent Fis family transcriptional regulator [Polyangium sp. y55x31]